MFVFDLHFWRQHREIKMSVGSPRILPSAGHENNRAQPKADKSLSSTSHFFHPLV